MHTSRRHRHRCWHLLAAAATVSLATTGCIPARNTGMLEPGEATAPTPAAGMDAATLASLESLLASADRPESSRARDRYRHPRETLEFLGIRSNMTVVEVWPQNDGWSPEFLAPLLRDTGRYLLATAEPDAPEAYAQRELSLLRRKFADRPDLYSRVVMTNLATASAAHPVMANSADAVVSFDSLHVWMRHGTALTVLRAMHAALKPGGILGLVDHRAGSDTATDPTARNGYVGEAQAIALAQQAGFEFVGGSEINANPEDTRDYELGAFVLPPTYRLGDKDRSRYTAIGESDRFTLKFIKPSSQRRSAP